MHILLPPSETKARGGDGPALDLDTLVFPELHPQRERLIKALGALSRDPVTARTALKVSAAKDGEIAANGVIRVAPTMPALQRYTGVLYSALQPTQLSPAEQRRAEERIIVISALFGAVRGSDLIPAYRLSAGSAIPGLGTIASVWRQPLAHALAQLAAPVLDLRSGAYATFAPVPDAITVRVVTEKSDGTKTVVSHANKSTKGRLARLIATARTDITTIEGVLRVATDAGMRAERMGPKAIEVLT